MSLLDDFLNRKSANQARERLKLVLSHERCANIPYIEDMKREILQVVQKYTRSEQVNISTRTSNNTNMLEVEITLGQD